LLIKTQFNFGANAGGKEHFAWRVHALQLVKDVKS
jgi:hypothetical protein